MTTPLRALTSTALAAVLASTLAGCLVRTVEPGQRVRYVDRPPSCRPSQHWDGERCRHNGRGHGARKHDDD